LAEYSQTNGFSRGSIGESIDRVVLHRPVELARVIGDCPTTRRGEALTGVLDWAHREFVGAGTQPSTARFS